MTMLACLACVYAQAGPLEMLITGLSGGDEIVRTQARQLLPRENVLDAVPKVLPLLANDKAAVWCAANNVLADFANQVAAPGHEAAQLFVAGQLMTLLAPEQPEHLKIRGMKLLPIVVPEGYDVAPVAALLSGSDDNLREKARACLEEIGTTEAAQSLCAALGNATPPFQAALLISLSRVHKPACENAVLELTTSPDSSVRAAAGLALAWTGNPAYAAPLVAVWKSAEPAALFDSCDGLLRLADAMARQGGKWELAMNVYRQVLQEDTNIVQQSGAMAGLGRFGDESVIPDILAALKGLNGRELEPAALAAFGSLPGVGTSKALLAAYPNLSEDMRLGMLAAFGRKQDALFLPLLNEAARNADPLFRHAALNALIDSQLSGALEGLAALASSATPEERPLVLDSVRRMACVLRDRGERDAAGKAYLTLYQVADTPELREAGLEGVKQFPIPEAFDVIMSTMTPDEVAGLSPGVMFALAKAMADAGRVEDAQKLQDSVMARMNTTDAVRDAIRVLEPSNPGPEMALRLGFVNAWHVVGPFPWSMGNAFSVTNINEPDIDLSATYAVDDKTVAWKEVSTPALNGLINLMGDIGPLEHVCAYAFTKITVPEAADAVVRTGSDDGIKVWVNGQPIIENNVDRGADIDQDQGAAKLNAGENTLLVEITQNGGGWNFCLRLTRPDGTVLPFSLAE
jgi:HEAT repeat protein